jgi:hypothetical protein
LTAVDPSVTLRHYEEVFVMELAKVNAHYQLTIPKSVRQKAKVRKGSYSGP